MEIMNQKLIKITIIKNPKKLIKKKKVKKIIIVQLKI
jgi:hypothetical protein